MTQIDTAKRPSEVKRLEKLLTTEHENLSICSISGPGGVGKTYLLNHVLSKLSPKTLNYLTLRMDGSSREKSSEFFGLVADQLAKRSLPRPAKQNRDYFPNTRNIEDLHKRLLGDLDKEIMESGIDPETRAAILSLVKIAHVCNEWMPVSNIPLKLVLSTIGNKEAVNKALDTVGPLLDGLIINHPPILDPLFELFGVSEKNRVKKDLYGITADAFIKDIQVAIDAPGRSVLSLTHPPIKGLKRLLLVIDDYEALHPVIGSYLLSALIPRLADSDFQTVMVICCRDDLDATDPSWNQHCNTFIKEDIRLTPFSEKAAKDLMSESGVPSEQQEGIYKTTSGFPFLLTLAIEEITTNAGGSALFIKKFYDRTTRWMNDTQKEWFNRVCYLDEVNEDSLSIFFKEDEVSAVQDWFEGESSIRDPDSPTFNVRPVIRNKTLEYMKVRSPKTHNERKKCASEHGHMANALSKDPT